MPHAQPSTSKKWANSLWGDRFEGRTTPAFPQVRRGAPHSWRGGCAVPVCSDGMSGHAVRAADWVRFLQVAGELPIFLTKSEIGASGERTEFDLVGPTTAVDYSPARYANPRRQRSARVTGAPASSLIVPPDRGRALKAKPTGASRGSRHDESRSPRAGRSALARGRERRARMDSEMTSTPPFRDLANARIADRPALSKKEISLSSRLTSPVAGTLSSASVSLGADARSSSPETFRPAPLGRRRDLKVGHRCSPSGIR